MTGFYGPLVTPLELDRRDVEMLTGPREPTPEQLWDWELEQAERRHLNDFFPIPAMPVSVVPLVPSSSLRGDGTPSWKAA